MNLPHEIDKRIGKGRKRRMHEHRIRLDRIRAGMRWREASDSGRLRALSDERVADAILRDVTKCGE